VRHDDPAGAGAQRFRAAVRRADGVTHGDEKGPHLPVQALLV
jgi:hypothetical protein